MFSCHPFSCSLRFKVYGDAAFHSLSLSFPFDSFRLGQERISVKLLVLLDLAAHSTQQACTGIVGV